MTNGSGLLRSHEEVQISSRIPVGVSTNECAGCGKRIRKGKRFHKAYLFDRTI